MGKKNRRVKNSNKPKRNVRNTVDPGTTLNVSGFAFDVSFEGLYYSVRKGSFTNYLKDKEQFIKKFKDLRKFIKNVKHKDFLKDLILDKGMKHCHIINDVKYDTAIECIESALKNAGYSNYENIVEQYLGGEDLYQIGFNSEDRYIGTYDENRKIFRMYLIDYHHRLFPDNRHNQYNSHQLIYCVMTDNDIE